MKIHKPLLVLFITFIELCLSADHSSHGNPPSHHGHSMHSSINNTEVFEDISSMKESTTENGSSSGLHHNHNNHHSEGSDSDNSDKNEMNTESTHQDHGGHHMNHEEMPMMHDQAVLSHNTDNHDHDMKAEHMNPMDMHDHMNMNGSGMHMMMKMWFHTGIDEVVLFEQWKIKSNAGMIASMVGIILLAMFYEGLKFLREYLFKQYISSMQFSTVAVTGESGQVTQIHKVQKNKIMSLAHAVQTGLHMVQIVMSYFLMLIFMTYNVWLCLSVVLGAGIGYFIFGWKKATVVDITEHCH